MMNSNSKRHCKKTVQAIGTTAVPLHLPEERLSSQAFVVFGIVLHVNVLTLTKCRLHKKK